MFCSDLQCNLSSSGPADLIPISPLQFPGFSRVNDLRGQNNALHFKFQLEYCVRIQLDCGASVCANKPIGVQKSNRSDPRFPISGLSVCFGWNVSLQYARSTHSIVYTLS